MRTVSVYYAYDGTEFYDPEECKAYEDQAIYHINQWNRCCIFFDSNMDYMILAPGLDIEKALDCFYEMLDKCAYIKINEKIPSDSFNFLTMTLDYYLPDNEVGLYKYDYDKGEWVRTN